MSLHVAPPISRDGLRDSGVFNSKIRPPNVFWHSMHRHLSAHATPARKHSQYFFRHADFLQWQPVICLPPRSEEHTSELQSLLRLSYDVFCLRKKKTQTTTAQCPAHIHT